MDNTRKTPPFIPLTPEEMKKEGVTASFTTKGYCTVELNCANVDIQCTSDSGVCGTYSNANGSTIAIVCDNKVYTCAGSGTLPGSGTGKESATYFRPIKGNKL